MARPLTLWLTGLSGSGKSTLSQALIDVLRKEGLMCALVDGDALRNGLCQGLGYSRADRQENVRRAAELCRHLNDAGVIAIAALISPYAKDRKKAGEIIGPNRFVEIHLSTPLAVCESRDPKGLYQRARRGEIPAFTGISDPYEVPLDPALRLDTSTVTLAVGIERIRSHLRLHTDIA
jgi:adenylylsulfate kinase